MTFLTVLAVLAARGARTGDKPAFPADASILLGHRFPVRAIAFSPDGASLQSAAAQPLDPREVMEIMTWDLTTAVPLPARSEFRGSVVALAGSGGATGTGDGSVWLGPSRLSGHRAAVTALAFAADGQRLVTAGQDEQLRLWDAAGRCLWTADNPAGRLVLALAFSPDGQTVASGGGTGVVQLWDASTGRRLASFTGHATVVDAVAFSPDGRTLASGDIHGIVRLWDVTTEQQLATLTADTVSADRTVDEVSALAFAPDGRILAVACGRAVQLWDVATRRLVAVRTEHAGKVQCLAFSPDGLRLASGGHDHTVRIMDVAEAWPGLNAVKPR